VKEEAFYEMDYDILALLQTTIFVPMRHRVEGCDAKVPPSRQGI
jgi:hypothetical protein